MHVTATQRGFYVKLREPGEEFDVPKERFSATWMREVEVVAESAPVISETLAPAVEEVAVPAAEPSVSEPIVKKRRGRKPKAVSE